MDQKEKELLIEIKDLFYQIQDSSKGEIISGIVISKPNGLGYVTKVYELLDKVVQLNEQFHPDYLQSNAIRELKVTIGKEVDEVERINERCIRGKISQSRLIHSMDKASFQIKNDLLELLNKNYE